jgi:hypothetical protein
LAACFLAAALPGCEVLTSFDAACEKRLSAASVSVHSAPMEYATDFSLSATDLNARGAAAAGQMTLGYIETRLKVTLGASGNGLVHPLTRRYCVRPQVEISLAFAPTTLYVAREQPEGSCEFGLVMDHELKHFREYERFLAELTREVEKELPAVFDKVLHFGSRDAGEKAIGEMISAYLTPRLQRAQADIAARQAKFDTPEEYFRLDRYRDSCAPSAPR